MSKLSLAKYNNSAAGVLYLGRSEVDSAKTLRNNGNFLGLIFYSKDPDDGDAFSQVSEKIIIKPDFVFKFSPREEHKST